MSHDDSDTSTDSSSSYRKHRRSRQKRRRKAKRKGSRHSVTSSSSSYDSYTSNSSSGSSWTESEAESDGGRYQPSEGGISINVWIMLGVLVVAGGILVFTIVSTRGNASQLDSADTGEPVDGGTRTSSTPTKTGSSSGSIASGSDFLESLAASYSMTPAKVRDLPPPSTAIPSPTPAMDYMKSAWSISNPSVQEFASFVEDPLEDSGDVVLSIEYPQGSYSGGTKGGANMRMNVFGEGKMRAMISYQVGFEEGFDFVEGGKLAGLFGGDPSDGCTGGKGSESCFSARFMWRENGDGEVYAYLPTYEGQCSEELSTTSVYCHDKFGQSFNRGSFRFEVAKWNTITEVAILNSNPSTSDTEANGYLAVYHQETLAFERSDVVYRTNSSVFFSSLLFQTFFGGSTEDYASPVLTHTYYKNWKFFEGDDASTESGKSVVASMQS